MSRTQPSAILGRGVPILLVGPSQIELNRLEAALGGSAWEIRRARTCGEARLLLSRVAISVVLCCAQQDDGTWRSLLEGIAGLAEPPRLVVFSRLADERLWAEVLNLGAYDLLPMPCAAGELRRVVLTAFESWRNEAQWRARKLSSRAEAAAARPA